MLKKNLCCGILSNKFVDNKTPQSCGPMAGVICSSKRKECETSVDVVFRAMDNDYDILKVFPFPVACER